MKPKPPTSLVIVAVLFAIGGVFALLEMVVDFARGMISINFGVLGILIGPGLLRYSRGWRTCALVFIIFGLILVPIIFVLMVMHSGPTNLEYFGSTVGTAPIGLGLVLVVLFFLFFWWQYHVLTRPDVKRLFGITNTNDHQFTPPQDDFEG